MIGFAAAIVVLALICMAIAGCAIWAFNRIADATLQDGHDA